MNRRQVIAAASATVACGATGAIALPTSGNVVLLQSESIEPVLCVNPWRQARFGDALVRPSEVKYAERIGWEDCDMGHYLSVETYDGRHLTTELSMHQHDIQVLVDMLSHRGVKVRTYVEALEQRLQRRRKASAP